MSEKRFIVESVMIDCLCEDDPRIAKVITDTDENYSYEDLYEVAELLNEKQATIQSLKEEKDYLVAVIDENLLKGYHEQSLKHKEAKEKMAHEDERMEASIILDVVFYWEGYVKALEELKERVSDE